MNRLHHHPFCPRSRSIRLALYEVGLDAERVDELPWSWRPEFLALNPSGELPVLEWDGFPPVAGVFAIAEFLDELTAPVDEDEWHGRLLFPGDIVVRSEVRRLVDWFHLKLDREASAELLETKIFGRLRGDASGPPGAETMRGLYQNLRQHLRYLEHLTSQRDWLAGTELSFADFAAAGHVSVLDYLGDIAWDAYPATRLWYARLKSRPSFRSLLQDRIAGMPPQKHYAELDF